MKYYIITFGCQMNKSDSERIATVLGKMGFREASSEKEADLIVVNMCSVRQSAVDRVYGLLPKFKKFKIKNSKLKTVLTGCILKRDRGIFAKGFDQILKIQDLLKYQPKYKNNFSAFILISNGCNNACSYCVVPYVRGPLICRDYQEILEEAKNVIKKGFKEIWLLGQNVNSYNSRIISELHSRILANRNSFKLARNNTEVNFAELLAMVNDIPGDFWIRFTSPHPNDFSDELIETIAQYQKVTPYLNLPVQSGDDEILRKMSRSYTIEYYKNLVKKIRSAFKKYRKAPHQNKFGTGYRLEKEIAISTDIIVGFPGETKKQFENTIRLFKKIKFDMAYIAKYSPRPGTTAAKLKDDVPPKEKERRYKILTEILKETALEKNKKYVGKEVEVLIDEARNGFLLGKTRHYKTVKINLTPKTYHLKLNLIGQFIKVKIKKALPWGLKGEI